MFNEIERQFLLDAVTQSGLYGKTRDSVLKKLLAAKTSKAKCMDCGLPYEEFGADLVVPRKQWLQLHPGDGGLLCATCMLRRVEKEIPDAINITGRITFGSEYGDGSTPYDKISRM